MRHRYIQQPDGTLVEIERDFMQKPIAPIVMPDIKEYKSMIDGSIITSRSKHREHLRAHGCIEIGNEVKHLKPYGDYSPPPGRKEKLIAAANQLLKEK